MISPLRDKALQKSGIRNRCVTPVELSMTSNVDCFTDQQKAPRRGHHGRRGELDMVVLTHCMNSGVKWLESYGVAPYQPNHCGRDVGCSFHTLLRQIITFAYIEVTLVTKCRLIDFGLREFWMS